MVLKYLINDDDEREKISSFKPEGVDSTMVSVEEESFWYARYSLEGKDERTARKMSEIDSYVREHFNVIVLQNDCSEYFNNRLYPLMSMFERKLRRMLYVFSGIKKDDESVKEINKLEEKNLGEIFSLLFIDDGFMSRVKDNVKKRNREEFSKAEILKLIEEERESVLWDNLLGKDIVPTLRLHFREIRNSRNDIMHSHDIGYKEYRACRKLLEKINREIDEALNNVSIKEQISKRTVPFGKTLAQALNSQDYFAGLQAMSVAAETMASVVNSPDFESLQKSIQNITSTVYHPEMDAMRETIKQLTNVAYSPDISQITSAFYKANPAFQQIAEQQRMLANLAVPLKDITDTFRRQQGLYNHLSSEKMDDEDGDGDDNKNMPDEKVNHDEGDITDRKVDESGGGQEGGNADDKKL